MKRNYIGCFTLLQELWQIAELLGDVVAKGLCLREIEQLPTFSFVKLPAGGSTGSSDCSVCLEIFQEGEQLRRLPCLHFFHTNCIDPWLEVSSDFCHQSVEFGYAVV